MLRKNQNTFTFSNVYVKNNFCAENLTSETAEITNGTVSNLNYDKLNKNDYSQCVIRISNRSEINAFVFQFANDLNKNEDEDNDLNKTEKFNEAFEEDEDNSVFEKTEEFTNGYRIFSTKILINEPITNEYPDIIFETSTNIKDEFVNFLNVLFDSVMFSSQDPQPVIISEPKIEPIKIVDEDQNGQLVYTDVDDYINSETGDIFEVEFNIRLSNDMYTLEDGKFTVNETGFYSINFNNSFIFSLKQNIINEKFQDIRSLFELGITINTPDPEICELSISFLKQDITETNLFQNMSDSDRSILENIITTYGLQDYLEIQSEKKLNGDIIYRFSCINNSCPLVGFPHDVDQGGNIPAVNVLAIFENFYNTIIVRGEIEEILTLLCSSITEIRDALETITTFTDTVGDFVRQISIFSIIRSLSDSFHYIVVKIIEEDQNGDIVRILASESTTIKPELSLDSFGSILSIFDAVIDVVNRTVEESLTKMSLNSVTYIPRGHKIVPTVFYTGVGDSIDSNIPTALISEFSDIKIESSIEIIKIG